ncbi:tail fiber domain-containing protein [Burkholderia latens]|uniref:tail fiber domain-containing protein n=1 Tax=Burkholderia latens TaxID=488446 RepID=UPI001AE213A7|nr:tail fiber domain-containing protein [Burkholderia latens]QTO49468.1 tail fiber domain-containing protein [Burkholderia latens]
MANIIGNLPVTLQNGTTADASQVMTDLNFIANQVNANAMPANVQTLSVNQVTITAVGTPPALLTLVGTSDANGAGILLEGNGATTPNKTIRAQNGSFQVVNHAFNASIFVVDDTGNVTASGDVTAASDERLKKDWKPLADDFVEQLASLRCGTYTRTDTDARQVGVGAQSLQAFLPEAVRTDEDGMLSVAYGQAALAACVELAKEVMRLRVLLEASK